MEKIVCRRASNGAIPQLTEKVSRRVVVVCVCGVEDDDVWVERETDTGTIIVTSKFYRGRTSDVANAVGSRPENGLACHEKRKPASSIFPRWRCPSVEFFRES